nr:hypothetical protein [Tanacetum cinerariifolium]
CGDSLDGIFCQRCTCESCGNDAGLLDTPLCYLCTCEHCRNILINGTCSKCNSGARNSFTYDPIPKSFNEIQSISNPPPQSRFKIYLCQLCESNSHYGYECSQRVPLVYELEPSYNQSFSNNAYPHDSPGVTPLIDHHCCYKCGDSLDSFFCNQCTYEFYGNRAHDGYNCPSQEIYSNPLFDEEIISMKIDLHHFNAESNIIESLLNHDSSIISSSSKTDSLLDEFAGELILVKSIPLGNDKTDCDPEEEIRLIEKLLYDNSSPRPPEEFIFENSDAAIESFPPSPILIEDSDSLMEEIDLSFTPDDSMPSGIENDDYDSEMDMLILGELSSNESLSLPENEAFHFDIPSSSCPPAKPPDDDSGILNVKVMGDISEHSVPMPRLLPTQPTLASNQEKSPYLQSWMFHFSISIPLDQLKYGGIGSS